MKKILISLVLVLVLLPVLVNAATYYVDATGGDDSYNGQYPTFQGGSDGPWKTISKVNSMSFSPGDYILFKRGEVWRSEGWSERLRVPSSGSSGNPITFGAYGTGDKPKILGSIAKNSVSDWTNEAGNLWYASSTSEVGNLIMDYENSYATMVLNKIDLDTQGEAWWDSANSRIYIYSTSNPAIYYNGWIECAIRGSIIDVNDKAHITIDGLDLRYTSRNAIYLYHSSTGDYLKVKNCNIKFCGNSLSGYPNWGGAGVYAVNLTSLTFMNNTVDYVWHAVWHGDDEGGCVATITDNIVTHVEMGQTSSAFAFGGDTQMLIDYTGSVIRGNDISGFKLKGISMSHSSNFIIEHNVIHDGYDEVSNAMIGISLGARTQRGHIVRYNHIYNIKGNPNSWAGGVGISTRNTGNAKIYYNVIHDCTKGATDGRLDQNVNDDNNNNAWYNNIFYNCDQYGMRVHVGVNAGDKKSITIQNNVLDGNTDDILVNDYVDVTGGWNCLVNDASIGLGTGSTYSGSTNDLYQTNPLFTDPSNNIFTLQSNSPCIDAGTNVGLTQDYEGNIVPQGSAPDIGAYEFESVGETPVCEPNTYYVDATNGDDSNDGRCTTTAWQTISKVNGETFSPGDNVLFKRGEIWRERLIVPSSGSSGNPITFGKYGSGNNPLILGSNDFDNAGSWTSLGSNQWATSSGSVTSDPVHFLYDTNTTPQRGTEDSTPDSNWEWYYNSTNDRVIVYHSSGNPASQTNGLEIPARIYCISVAGTKDYITIDGIDCRFATSHNILFFANSLSSGVKNLISSYSGEAGVYLQGGNQIVDIDNVTTYYTRRHGVVLVEVSGGTVQNCDLGYSGSVQSDGHALNIYKSSNLLIDNNHLHHSFSGSGIGGDRYQNCTIQNNEVNNNAICGIDISGAADPYKCFDNIIRYNLVHDHPDPAISAIQLNGNNPTYESYDNEVYYNIITNSKRGILITGNANTNKVYNNIIYNVTSEAIYFDEKNSCHPTGNIFKNNIVHTAGGRLIAADTNLFEAPYNDVSDYNYFYDSDFTNKFYYEGNYNTLADFRTATGQDANSKDSDPLFVNPANDFHVQSGSPTIDVGIDIGLTQDYEGNLIPQGAGVDIGAYEFESGAGCGVVPGDLDVDCDVDIFDLIIVTSNFGSESGFDPRADTISNGEIDIYDLVFVASRFT